MSKFKKGIKFDQGKPNYLDIFELLDFDFLVEVSEVMAKGKEKYGFENWKKDLDPKRIKKALLRHLKSYLQGELYDKETGKTHLAHITCNVMFLHFYQNRGKKI